jgi:hypothetical protein
MPGRFRHADFTVNRSKSGVVVTLSAARSSASLTPVNADPMMLNLGSDHLLLQASQDCFALAYRRSHGGRIKLRYTLNRGNLMFGGFARNHLGDQLLLILRWTRVALLRSMTRW